MSTYITGKAIDLQYTDLVEGKDLGDLIEEAYGPDGLGILTVSGVPNVEHLRQNLLPLAYQFASLPDDVKKQYEHAISNYSFGWSHGKEKFQGKLDVAKGSFYANPQYDVPTTDESLIQKYPFYCSENIWPTEHIPALEKAFKEMGQLIVQIGLLVSKQCDKYIKKQLSTYEENKLHKHISDSRIAKGRLLYYFPIQSKNEIEEASESCEDNWCGWHLDHGSLTGLLSAMYIDQEGNQIEMTDPNAGLFIRNRRGDLVKVGYKANQLAFQIGESAQIHTGGKLVATPHCVRGASTPGVGRATLAVFMQPQWDVEMAPPQDVPIEDCKIDVLTPGMDFNAFSEKRFESYYGTN